MMQDKRFIFLILKIMALKNLFKKPDLNEVIKDGKEIVKVASNKEQGSRRHETDMLSDNKLSKNIRPIIIIWTFILFTLMLISIVFFKVVFPEKIMQTIFVILGAEILFYFPGRSIEKYLKSKLK